LAQLDEACRESGHALETQAMQAGSGIATSGYALLALKGFKGIFAIGFISSCWILPQHFFGYQRL